MLCVVGTFATTIPILLGTQVRRGYASTPLRLASADHLPPRQVQAAVQLQKLFLVSIAFKLVQKNNQLNQLFKTAA